MLKVIDHDRLVNIVNNYIKYIYIEEKKEIKVYAQTGDKTCCDSVRLFKYTQLLF